MGCATSRHTHVDFDVAVDALPPYSEKQNHGDAVLEMALEAAEATSDVVAAATLLAEASNLDVAKPELKAKVLAALIDLSFPNRGGGYSTRVQNIVQPAIAKLRSGLSKETLRILQPLIVTELAKLQNAART